VLKFFLNNKCTKTFFAFSHFIHVFAPPFRRFNFAFYTLSVFALSHFIRAPRNAGDFSEAPGEREIAPKCGNLAAPVRCGRLGRSAMAIGQYTGGLVARLN